MDYYTNALMTLAAQAFAVLAIAVYIFVCPWVSVAVGKIKHSLRHK